MRCLGFVAVAAAFFVVPACGSSDPGPPATAADASPDTTARVCAPGLSIACIGPGACSGGQPCKADGSGYDPCICGTADGGADAPSDSPGDSPLDSPPTWSPADLAAALVLWLDDTPASMQVPDGGTGTLTKWADRTTLHNDATPGAPGGGLDKPPRVTASALHGHAIVTLDGNHYFLSIPSSPTLLWGTGTFGVAMVVRSSAGTSPWDQRAQPNVGLYQGLLLQTGPQVTAEIDVPVPATNPDLVTVAVNTNNATFHVVVARRTAGTMELRVDGTSSTVAATHDASGGAIYLGGSPTTGSTAADFAEIVGASLLSDTDVTKLEAYFKAKFAL